MTTRVTQRARLVADALAALVALLAVIVGLPVVLVTIGAVPRGLPTVHEAWQSVRSSDPDGHYFLAAGAMIVWLAWAVFVAITAKELVTLIHHRGHEASMQWHGIHRLRPAALVATIAVLVVSSWALPGRSGLVAPALATRDGHSMSVVSLPTPAPDAVEPGAVPGVQNGSKALTEADPDCTYVVQRYDTLWSIAAHHLVGNPAERYLDIKVLNPNLIGPDNEIVTGVRLVLPDDAYGLSRDNETGSSLTEVTVRPGDTLSAIAADAGIADWRSVWPLNYDTLEPGGRRLTDPDHIEPGWTIKLPSKALDSTPAPTPPPMPNGTPSTPSQPTPPPPGDPSGSPAPSPRSTPSATNTSDSPERARSHDHLTDGHAHQAAGTGSWDFIFAGGGVFLAAGLFASLRFLRRGQIRHRRPGRAISPTPEKLVPVEQELKTRGPAAMADVEILDHALRSISAWAAASEDRTLPAVVAVRAHPDGIELRLDKPHGSEPPWPWVADDSGCAWSVSDLDELPVTSVNEGDYPAPYPTLVAVGYDENGSNWLVDLEAAGVFVLTGAKHRCLDLVRFIAAELAVNPWSDQALVTLAGFGEEVVALNPGRLSFAPDIAESALSLDRELATMTRASNNVGMDVISARVSGVAGDSWMPHVLLVADLVSLQTHGSDDMTRLARALHERMEPSGVALVLVRDNDDFAEVGTNAFINEDGRLNIPRLGLDLIPQQLPQDEVEALAQLIAHLGQTEDAPMPASEGDRAIDHFNDVSGSLLAGITLPRVPDADDARGFDDTRAHAAGANGDGRTAQTLLPYEDEVYLQIGATSSAELGHLAPRVNPDRQFEIVASDPTLEDELADWLDPESRTPRLRLLGPVEVTAHGLRPPKRISYYTEIVAYLATRDHGATAEQVGAAFNLTTGSAYSRINIVRNWLGTNPATGEKYLPDSTSSSAGRARGVGVYEFEGVAVDADLFRRLRTRGQALGGATGIVYLHKALRLVGGRPFDQLRPGGYGWLSETPLDHYLTAGIVDVAHTVHLHHLQAGDLGLARAAAELALLASPFEEIPRLDLAAVMTAEGNGQEAERYLDAKVYSRSEDGQAPDDLPERTEAILRRRERLSRVS